MKLGEFLPDISTQEKHLVNANAMLGNTNVYLDGFAHFAKSRSGLETIASPVGIEQLYMDWLRQSYAYRRQMLQDLYLVAFDSSEVRIPLLQLKRQIFRKGFDDWKPKFHSKCKKCGMEHKDPTDKCQACKSTELRKPKPDQYREFDKFRMNCNVFEEDLESVLGTLNDDICIADDLWLYKNKQYKILDGKLNQQVVEIRRIHPALVEFDLDKDGKPKNSHWFCLFHRDDIQEKAGECPACKQKLVPVMYIYNHRGKRMYLAGNEMVHRSIFSTSPTYGYSPLLTILQKVLTLNGMDRQLYRYFFERKMPTGMVITYTDDPGSLEIERARIEAKMMEDPTYMPWVAASQKTGRGRTDFIRFFQTLQEMDYLPVRSEIRDRVAGIYGVPQLYNQVIEGIGGISGQTQQVKMFSDVIQSFQRMYNEYIFPEILSDFGVTDWEIKLRPPEEKAEGEIVSMAQQKTMVASQLWQMGFKVELKPECKDIATLDFQFSGEAKDQSAMFGGGMPGGGVPVPGQEGQQGAPGTENPEEQAGISQWDRKQPQEEGAYMKEPDEEEEQDDEDDDSAENKVFNR